MLETLQDLHGHLFAPDRLPLALGALGLAIVAGMVTGPLGGNAMPLYWRVIDALFGRIGGRLDKTGRPASDLMFRGFIITATGMAVSYLIGRMAAQAAWLWPAYHIVEIILLSLTFSAGAVWYALFRLHTALSTEGAAKGAFYVISRSTRTNLAANDEYTITRVGMGMGARAFDKALVAPILWYLIGGLEAAYLYAGLAALAWRFGKDGFTAGFGQVALALEKLLGFIPTAMAGILIALAGVFTPTGRTTSALKSLFSKQKAAYFEGGLPVSAMAYALQVSLGGATQDLDGSAIRRRWAGPPGATAQLGPLHLHRGLYLIIIAHILLVAALLGAFVVSGHDWLDF